MVAELEAQGYSGEELVRRLMLEMGIDETEARQIIAIEHGTGGRDRDVEIVDE